MMWMYFLKDSYKLYVEPFLSGLLGLVPTPPLIDRVAEDDMINAAERGRGVTVTGSAGAGSTVRLDWNGTSKTVTVDSSGKWSATFSNSEIPKDGHTTISASTTNAAGMVSAATTRSVMVDTLAPKQPTLGPVTGDNRITAVEKAAGITLTGIADPNSTVDVYWRGTERTSTKSVTTDATGRWSATFAGGEIPAGKTAIDLVATDRAGNPSAVSIWENVMVGAAPGAPLIDPVGGDDMLNAYELTRPVTVTGKAEAGSIVRLVWGDVEKRAAVSEAGYWQATFFPGELPINEGLMTLHATASDAAGNLYTTTKRSVTVDTIASQPTLDPVTGDNRITAAEQAAGLTLTGSAELDSYITVEWEGQWYTGTTVDSTGRWSLTLTSEQTLGGGGILKLRTDDQAGNTSNWQEYAVTVDRSAPDTLIVAKPSLDTDAPYAPLIDVVNRNDVLNAYSKMQPVTVRGHAEGGSTVRLVWGAVEKIATTSEYGYWEAIFFPQELPAYDGLTTLHATAYDAAGNVSATTSRSVTVDTIAPQRPTLDPVTGDNRITEAEQASGLTLTGSAEPGSFITLMWEREWHTGVWVDNSGQWSLTLTREQVLGGAGTLQLLGTDRAENNSAWQEYKVRVDPSAPNTLIVQESPHNMVIAA